STTDGRVFPELCPSREQGAGIAMHRAAGNNSNSFPEAIMGPRIMPGWLSLLTLLTAAAMSCAADPLVGVLKGHEGNVGCLAFAPDGRHLAVGSGYSDQEKSSGEIKLWELATLRVRCVLRGHTHRVVGLAFAPDGKTLASAARDDTVRLWDLGQATGRVIYK